MNLKQYSKQTLINLICLVVILICFLVVPWFGIHFGALSQLSTSLGGSSLDVRGSALTFPIKLAANKAGLVSSLKSLSSDFASDLNGFTAYTFSWYIILVFVIFTTVNFLRTQGQMQFAKNAFLTFIVSLAVCIVFLIVRAAIIANILSSTAVSAVNSLGRLVGVDVETTVRSMFSLGAGFYIIMIVSIAGIVCQIVLKKVVKPTISPQTVDDTQSVTQNPYQSVTSDNQPVITLVGEHETVPIDVLAGSIGSGVNATHRIHDASVKPAHLEIREAKGAIAVQALQMPSMLNGSPMQSEQFYRLMDGDRLTIGEVTFTVYITNNPAGKEIARDGGCL